VSKGRVCYQGREVTTIFMDFNTDTLLNLHRETDCSGLIEAVRQDILVNPRGMESINSKGIFEVVSGSYRDTLCRTTVARTPWTRMFHARKTTAPDGSPIQDLVDWTRNHQETLVLKPAHGYSGHGVFVGPERENWEEDIETALKEGDYIVQQFIQAHVSNRIVFLMILNLFLLLVGAVLDIFSAIVIMTSPIRFLVSTYCSGGISYHGSPYLSAVSTTMHVPFGEMSG